MVGEQIRALREAKSWSQAHLADAAGVNVRTVQRIESGESCSYETALSLAAALNVDVALLGVGAASLEQTDNQYWRVAGASAFLLPAVLFITVNMLRSPAGITAPYDAFASAGGKIMSFRTFNLLSPIVFIGGAAGALLFCLPQFFGIRTRRSGAAVDILAVQLRANWIAIGLAAVAVCSLAALAGYVAVENLFTGPR